MDIIGIEWDTGNCNKCQKHGVSIAQIEEVLTNPCVQILLDGKHSNTEQRFWVIGSLSIGRSVFLVTTLHYYADGIYVRPISARFMHRKEVVYYEKNS